MFDPIEFLLSLLQLRAFDYLRDVWGPQPWVEPVLDIAGIIIVSTFNLLIVIFLIWLERKVIARIQDRIGPNRVGGKFGLLQTVADVLKLLSKEDVRPTGTDKYAYLLAPLPYSNDFLTNVGSHPLCSRRFRGRSQHRSFFTFWQLAPSPL